MFLIAGLIVLLILPSPWNLIVSGACLVGFGGEVGFWNLRVRGKRKRVGVEALIDAEGTVLTPCHPIGQVLVVGEAGRLGATRAPTRARRCASSASRA
jgi:membrane-bound ClpP family serine protease